MKYLEISERYSKKMKEKPFVKRKIYNFKSFSPENTNSNSFMPLPNKSCGQFQDYWIFKHVTYDSSLSNYYRISWIFKHITLVSFRQKVCLHQSCVIRKMRETSNWRWLLISHLCCEEKKAVVKPKELEYRKA